MPDKWLLITQDLFTSNPPGALVTAGGASCATPCYLNVPIRTQKAVFALYSGVKEEVAISHLTSRSAAAQYGVEKTGEYTFYSLALPFLVVGGLAALGVAILYQSDTIETAHSSRDETIFIIVGATGLVTGATLAFVGQTISDSARDVEPEVYVKLEKPQHFPLLSNPTSIQQPAAQRIKAADFFKEIP